MSGVGRAGECRTGDAGQPRDHWANRVGAWLEGNPHTPDWDRATQPALDTGVRPRTIMTHTA